LIHERFVPLGVEITRITHGAGDDEDFIVEVARMMEYAQAWRLYSDDIEFADLRAQE